MEDALSSTAPHLSVVKQHLIFGPKGSGKNFYVKTQLAKQFVSLELSAQNVTLQSDFQVDEATFAIANAANLFCNPNWFGKDKDVFLRLQNLFAWARQPVYKYHSKVSVKLILFEDTETIFSTDFQSGMIVSTVQQLHSVIERNQDNLSNGHFTVSPTPPFLYPPFNILPTMIQQIAEQIKVQNVKTEQQCIGATHLKHHIIYFLYTTSRPSCFPQELFDFLCGLPIYVPLPNFTERHSFIASSLSDMANAIHRQLQQLGHLPPIQSSIIIQLFSKNANMVYNLASSAGAPIHGEMEERELQKMLSTISRLSKGSSYQKMVAFFASLNQRCSNAFLSTCNNSTKESDANRISTSKNGLHMIVLEEGDILSFTNAFFSSTKLFYHNEEVYAFARMIGYKILPDEMEEIQQTTQSIRTLQNENK